MILLELKRYIRQHRQVTAANLLHRFDISQATLEGLMTPLLQQGFIYRQSQSNACSSGCQRRCHSTQEDIYYWSERALTPLKLS
jgi:hypothetical protein